MGERHPLTGLYFGSAYFAEAEAFIKNADEKQYCMIAIDVERFGLFNKVYGEAEGDRLLLVISELLKEYKKEHASILGYLGGDNFSMVTEYNRDTLDVLCKKIREEIRIQNKTAGFPPAYGAYVITDKEEPIVQMYNHATVALSYVKGNYSNRWCEYKKEMDGKEEEEIRLFSEIREGMEKDEFTFFIQPQVDINLGKIVGGESLVRWIHGEKGMVSPGVFIPVMEKHGFIADLDMIVWDKVCKWLRSCIDRGYKPVPISVNVSRIDIFSLDVPSYIISLVEKYDISPDLLKIEITESAYAEEGEVIHEAVDRLREYGFIVMMDDFGSGYSSLNMLKSVPVDVLKMDMRFLEINESEEEKGVGILESVINMARQMRIPIVVEGVETIVQESLLQKMGCSYAQGFYYYRPMAIDAFEVILSDKDRLDHSGFWYRQAESIHLREFMDTNLFNDTVINNILGPAVFYEMVGKKIEITRVNSQYFELMGVTRKDEEGYQDRFWNSVRDDDRPNLYAIFEEAYAKQKEGASGFINLIRRDGLTLWVNIRVYFLREKDQHRLFYASLTDMTAKKAETKVPASVTHPFFDITEEQAQKLDNYYGTMPIPFAIFKPYINSEGRPYYFQIVYANTQMSQIGGGDMQRLGYLLQTLFKKREESILNAMCAAAYDGLESEDFVYSDVSNRYYNFKWYPYFEGYACCFMEDATLSQIHQSVAGNIMQSFREVYFLNMQDNYCRMIYPYTDELVYRGNFDEIVSRGFESGKILPYDEAGVRNFLSVENIQRELRKKDTIEYKYKRSVFPAGEEWSVTTITISEREENGTPKTATITVRSIEALMREKESDMRMNMAKMLETMSAGFFIYNAGGDEEMLYANPPVVRMFGCRTITEFKELTKYSFRGLVHPEDLKRVEWEINSQIEETDRNMDYIRYRIIRKDGEVRWVDDVGHLETSEYIDGPKRFYVFVSDITDSITEAEKVMLIEASKRFNEMG